jgi:hypothetical protein
VYDLAEERSLTAAEKNRFKEIVAVAEGEG